MSSPAPSHVDFFGGVDFCRRNERSIGLLPVALFPRRHCLWAVLVDDSGATGFKATSAFDVPTGAPATTISRDLMTCFQPLAIHSFIHSFGYECRCCWLAGG
eukprot:GABV01010059.1.p1 GENE.GABV01010059.1~~GABV01010059.1.p1  ORF type:complete len:102 (+),score=12.40 GABV01010059.1:52-357(+)